MATDHGIVSLVKVRSPSELLMSFFQSWRHQPRNRHRATSKMPSDSNTTNVAGGESVQPPPSSSAHSPNACEHASSPATKQINQLASQLLEKFHNCINTAMADNEAKVQRTIKDYEERCAWARVHLTPSQSFIVHGAATAKMRREGEEEKQRMRTFSHAVVAEVRKFVKTLEEKDRELAAERAAQATTQKDLDGDVNSKRACSHIYTHE